MTELPDPQRRDFLLGRFAKAARSPGPPVAAIGQSCFTHRGIACMNCQDSCPTGAVRLVLALGGARPRIDLDRCTGCGDCARACPAGAIRLAPLEATS